LKKLIDHLILRLLLLITLICNLIVNFIFKLFYFPKSEKFDLAIIKTDVIGDYIIWLDSLKAYKRAYIGKKVLLVCTKEVEDIALLDPFFSLVIPLDSKEFRKISLYRFRFIKKMRKYNFITAINPTYSRGFDSDYIVSILRCKEKIAFLGNNSILNPWVKVLFDFFYNRLIINPIDDTVEIYNNEYFVRQLFDEKFKSDLPIFPSFTNIPRNWEFLSSDYCVFFLSARFLLRSWDVENFIKLGDMLTTKYSIVLLGAGINDLILSDEFENKSMNKNMILNLVNKTTIIDSAHIVSKSKFVIGNDSGGVHLAVSLRVPSICIAPGAHYGRFVPYSSKLPGKFYHPRVVVYQMACFGCDYRCDKPIIGQYECIRRVSIKSVQDEIIKLLRDKEFNNRSDDNHISPKNI